MKGNEYYLDFVIPSGKEGSTGPIANEPKIFVTYENTANANSLTILNAAILPTNSNTFSIANEMIQFTETGNFIFTITGRLKETTTSNGATLILQTQNTDGITNHLITIQLQSGRKETYFAQTRVGQYGTLQTVTLIFEKDSLSDAEVEEVNLYIQKIPFPNG